LLPPLPFDGVEIGRIEKGRPADLAGLKPGDKIIKVNDTPTPAFEILVAVIGAQAGKEVTITYLREGRQHQVKMIPFNDQGRGRIGFARVPPSVPLVETRLGPGRALRESLRQNLLYLWITQEALRQIFRGQRTVRETFAGPLRIAEISGEAAAHGVKELIKLMSYLSLSLGVFNLLPIPVLDGGVIFLLLIEWFFGLAGRQMSVALREKIQTVGFALILIFMGYIIYSDIAMKLTTATRKIAEPPPAEQPAR
jgi:regulator of sigma E protease